ncbi:MAG: hypothetical protein E7258_05200 [Lachnospiraceae bacterium]|nr:hypothetical protein [Lachnospiraceae bacterium]
MNGSKINLLQMQEYFEKQMSGIHTLSDLELSENDYRSLSAKLKAFSFFSGSENDIEDYMISIVVYCTYTLIYGVDVKDFGSALSILLSKSQHVEKMRLRMYNDTFLDYGLNTFDIVESDLRLYSQKLTARHAGIPNKEKYSVYNIIDDCLDCMDFDELYIRVYKRLPPRTKFIFDLMDQNMQKTYLMDIKIMMCDVVDGLLPREHLLNKYPRMSVSLIDHCLMWNENNKQQIRYHIN